MRSLVVQTSFLGDVVLTTPLLARLARDGPVDVVTTPGGARLLAGHPAVATLITYDKHGTARGPRGFLRTARAVRTARAARDSASRGATRAYLCQGSTRSGALAFAAGCAERIGFDTSAGRWTYTDQVAYRPDWHHARRLLSLGDWALAESASDSGDAAIRPSLHPQECDVLAVDELLRGRERPIVALAPGSVWRTKRWPGYGELAAMLAPDFDIAIVGGADDAGAAGEIRLRVDRERVIDATGKLSLLGSAELLRRARALVTNDSSPQHLASAMGTPTVTIFGPTVPEFGFGPLAPGSRTIGRDALECRPCDRHGPQTCPLGHWRCMHEVVPHEVNEMARAVIATERGR